jgi:hypothetical protein
MPKATRRLYATAIGLSVAAHAVVLTVLALHAPKLTRPYELAGPPEPVIPVLIMPRTPPAPPGAEKPPPIRLHRRQLRRGAAPHPPVEPFVPPPSIPTPKPQPRPSGPPRYSVQPSPGTQLSTTLRGGLVGCANPSLLSRSERERCQEKFGRGAAGVPANGPRGDPALDRAAAARERSYIYKRTTPRPGSAAGPPGRGAEDIARGAGSDNPTLRIPF